MNDIELLTYQKYYETNKSYKYNYFLIDSNTQIQALKECVENAGLCLSLNHAVAIELYKINAIDEIKEVINIIAKEHEEHDNKFPIPFDVEKLPYIEPVDYETQIYNVILDDIENILDIEVSNRENMEKYFCECNQV